VYPEDREGARRLLEGFDDHLSEGCVGSISEIFDAEQPYTPRGCVAQAWSVAEVLRGLEKTGAGQRETSKALTGAVSSPRQPSAP
jgi:glycogen debranching enzyme